MEAHVPLGSQLKKAKMSRMQEKAMVAPFFEPQELIHTEWVPEGQDINKGQYLNGKFHEDEQKI